MKTIANFKTANEPREFYLHCGNSMYECKVIENREKSIKVKRFDSQKTFYNWYPKSGLINIIDDEFELAKWV